MTECCDGPLNHHKSGLSIIKEKRALDTMAAFAWAPVVDWHLNTNNCDPTTAALVSREVKCHLVDCTAFMTIFNLASLIHVDF